MIHSPDAAPRRFRLTPVTAAALAAAVTLVVAVATIDQLPVGVFYDDGMYVVLAKALATGRGYHWLHLPGAPAATHFPPGYPALLALAWAVFPGFPANVIAFKAINACLLAVVAASITLFACRRARMSARVALIVAVAGCAAIPMLVLSTQVMSETLFLAVLVPGLLLAEQVADRVPAERASVLVSLGILAGALMLVRSHGVAFVVALAVLWVRRRQWRALALVVVACAVTVLPWQVWKLAHDGTLPAPLRGSYESYGTWLSRGLHAGGLSAMARAVWQTVVELFRTMAATGTAGLPVAVRPWLTLALLGLLVVGARRLRRTAPVTVLFATAYGGVILIWPFAPARFIWGVWPLVILCAAAGAFALRDWHPPAATWRAVRGLGAAELVALAYGYGVYTVRGVRGRWWSSIPRRNAAAVRPLVQWTARNTAPQAVIASNAEVVVYLYTGRTSVPATAFSVEDYFAAPSVDARANALRSILQAYRVDAVAIVANDGLRDAARMLANHRPPELVLRDSILNGLIFSTTPR